MNSPGANGSEHPEPEAVAAEATIKPETPKDDGFKPGETLNGFCANMAIQIRSNVAASPRVTASTHRINFVDMIVLLGELRSTIIMEALSRVPRNQLSNVIDLQGLGRALQEQPYAEPTGLPTPSNPAS